MMGGVFGLAVSVSALLFAFGVWFLRTNRANETPHLCAGCGEKASPVGANRCPQCVESNQ